MARKDLPCAECGTFMWRSPTSAPEGVATCHPCRRQRTTYRPNSPNHGARVTSWECQGCGKRCERKPTKGQIPKWCEDCRAASAWQHTTFICACCGVETTGTGKKFCSIACSNRSKPLRPKKGTALVHVGPADPVCRLPAQHPVMRPRLRGPRRVFVGMTCVWCDTPFIVGGQLTARYCSTKCSRAYARATRGRFSVRPADRLAIYERDKWTCQLCMEPVDQDLATTDPFHDWAPSLDHVVPQSKGGAHDASNLRLAHRWCNAVRGAEDRHADLFVAA